MGQRADMSLLMASWMTVTVVLNLAASPALPRHILEHIMFWGLSLIP